MIKLYELSEQYNDFVRAIDSGIEFDADTMSDTLEAIQASFDDKAESIALIYKSLTMEAEAIKTEAKALAERAASKERTAERLKQYLSSNLQSIGQTKLETSKCKLSFRKSEKVTITDEDALYMACKVSGIDGLAQKVETVKFDKKALKDAIKSGVELNGAYIQTENNLQIK